MTAAPELFRAPPRELGNSELDKLRAMFADRSGMGLWLFSVHICGLDKMTLHLHLDMCRFLSRWGEPGWRRLMMMVPRGSFKTSIGSKALPLWIATLDPEVTIGIFNAAQDQAKSWIGSIRKVLESSLLYHRLWPENLPPGIHHKDREKGKTVPRSWKWGDAGLELNRKSMAVSELTFEAYGIGGSSTGKHYSHRIMDDLIGETAATSPAIIEDSIHFVDNARALEKPPNGGLELINCTPWAYRDCYTHLLAKWPDDYRVYRRSLLEHPETGDPDIVNGESIFPESISTEEARKMYEHDSFVFQSQYQCIPQSGKEISFQREWVRPCKIESHNGVTSVRIPPEHYDPTRVHAAVKDERAPDLVPLHWLSKAILIDPAPTRRNEKSQERRARNGLVAIGLDAWGRRFTLEARALREDPVVVLENVVDMARRWALHRVGIEEVNFSKVYAPLWSAILAHRYPGVDIQFVPLLTHGEDKDTRINAMKGAHREGLWYYNLDLTGYIVQELIEYPNSETRDLIDAQAYIEQTLSRPQTPNEQEIAFYSHGSDGRDARTGY